MEASGSAMCKSFPVQKELPPVAKWAQRLSKDAGDVKTSELLKEFHDVIYNAAKADPESLDFLIDLVKRSWFVYFYPGIYPKHVLPADKPFIEGIDPANVGYHPHCPAVINVWLLNR